MRAPRPARSESRGDVSVAPPAALAVPAMAKRLLRGTLRLWGGRAAPCLPPASRCSHSGGEERLETSSAKKLTDIGTRRIFSLEHDIFRESVRKFFQEEVIPYHAEWEKAGEVSRELWEKAGKQGLLGISIADHHGGIGGDLYSSAIVWEEQAYSNCTGPGFGLHSDIVMPYITNYGSEEQIKRFIPEMVAGKCIGAIAMTEPGAGSDLQGIRTNAKKDGSDWILNGSKTVKHKLAELKTSICVTRAFVDSCLQLHRVKRLDVATAAMAKYWASDLQNRVAYDCLQLHGGWGYMFECPIAKAYVDARVQTIYGGTNEIMKELIAREIIHDQ